jgi:RNA polymerase sigma-70 factor, ECF subfamily
MPKRRTRVSTVKDGEVELAASGDRRAADDLVVWYRTCDAAARTDLLDALAVHAARGSPSALEVLLRLVDEHRLDRVAIRRILIDDQDVEDAHQDVLIAVARSVHRFEAASAFTTWLYALARNTSVDHLRRRRQTLPLDDDEHRLTEASRISSMVAARTDLRAAVAALPEHYRAVLVLRDVEQRSYQEIADLLDLELNTVRSRLSRARALLAARLLEAPAHGPERG